MQWCGDRQGNQVGCGESETGHQEHWRVCSGAVLTHSDALLGYPSPTPRPQLVVLSNCLFSEPEDLARAPRQAQSASHAQILQKSSHRERPNTPAREMGMEWEWNRARDVVGTLLSCWR